MRTWTLLYVAGLLGGCEQVAGVRDVSLAPDGGVDSGPVGDASGDGGGKCASNRGPAMVEVSNGTGGSYCIDVTEVSEAQFASFIVASPARATLGLPARCDSVSIAAPDSWTVHATAGYARAYVNWCHAYAFCAWAGKRLCGELGTGAAHTGPEKDEWTYACSQGGTTLFPYGNAFVGGSCTTGEAVDGGRTEADKIMAAPKCHGDKPPFDAIYDMSGNLIEWVNDCTGTPEECAVRGGYFGDLDLDAACNARYLRDFKEPAIGVGFRCCK